MGIFSCFLLIFKKMIDLKGCRKSWVQQGFFPHPPSVMLVNTYYYFYFCGKPKEANFLTAPRLPPDQKCFCTTFPFISVTFKRWIPQATFLDYLFSIELPWGSWGGLKKENQFSFDSEFSSLIHYRSGKRGHSNTPDSSLTEFRFGL